MYVCSRATYIRLSCSDALQRRRQEQRQASLVGWAAWHQRAVSERPKALISCRCCSLRPSVRRRVTAAAVVIRWRSQRPSLTLSSCSLLLSYLPAFYRYSAQVTFSVHAVQMNDRVQPKTKVQSLYPRVTGWIAFTRTYGHRPTRKLTLLWG